jgi:heptosyltransferase-1
MKPDRPRILIIRTGAIGDIVMASPLLKALRRTYPHAHIAWLADPAVAGLLCPNPMLDEVILWSRHTWSAWLRTGRWGQVLQSFRQLRRNLHQRRFTMTLDIQGTLKSRLLAALSGAPKRIGFDAKEPGAFLMTTILSRGPDSRHMSSEYLYMARCLGLETADLMPVVALAEPDRQVAVDLLRAKAVPKRYTVLCPFTTRPQKHWLSERWPTLVRRLAAELDLPSVLLGGPTDREAAAVLSRAAGKAVVNLAGATRLGQSAAILSGAALVIGVDTGLTHMGTAFQRPTIALFGATCPYRQTPSSLTRVIYHHQPCAPCRRRPTCGDAFTCMTAIDTPEILAVAHELLS